jgi:hypothetical protein
VENPVRAVDPLEIAAELPTGFPLGNGMVRIAFKGDHTTVSNMGDLAASGWTIPRTGGDDGLGHLDAPHLRLTVTALFTIENVFREIWAAPNPYCPSS